MEAVKAHSVSLVCPEHPPPVSSMSIPSIDAMWHGIHYNRRVLFYRIRPPADFPSVVALLKTSLRQTLRTFYPWTGRLARSSSSNNDSRLIIDFTKDSGVEFVVASTDASYTDLLRDGFQLRPFFDKLCRWSHHEQSEIYDMPLLSIQVTEFLDGGIALGYAQNHVVADGSSMWHFMRSWSECARGLPISMPPLHQRDRFVIHDPSPELAWTPLDDLVLNKEGLHEEEEEEGEQEEENAPLTQRRFLFSTEKINRLKTLLASEKGGDGGGPSPFSTYEALCAHFWKRVTAARALQPSRRIHFTVLANCRSRVAPALPPSYFGNCVSFVLWQTAAGEILTESLAATALRVRGAIKKSTDFDASLHKYLHWLELHNHSTEGLVFPKGVGMLVASSPHFPCYEVDFGPTTGSPESVCTARIMGDGEMVLFRSRHNTDGIDICMALKPQVMDRLLSDPCLLNF